MSLQRIPWAVNGPEVPHSATLARQATFIADGGQTGIIGAESLIVSAGETPGPFVNVGKGSGSITYAQGTDGSRGYANAPGQSVPVVNDGTERVEINPTTSAGGRVDMICIEINDPEWEGTSDTVDYSTHEFVRFRVIQNVSSSARFPWQISGSSNRPLLPLARVHIPASTGTITRSMIRDIRYLAKVNSQSVQLLREMNPTGGNLDIPDDQTGWLDVAEFDDIVVPQWATSAKVSMAITHLVPIGGDVGGLFRLVVTGQAGPAPTNSMNFVDHGREQDRFQVLAAGQVNLARSTRGATCSVTLQIRRVVNDPPRPGTVRIPSFSTHSSMATGWITFEETPRFDGDGA